MCGDAAHTMRAGGTGRGMSEQGGVLPREQEVNRRYQEILAAMPEYTEIDGTRVRVPRAVRGPLTGRVRMRHPGDDEDDAFYIGPTHVSVDLGGGRETQVVSWAAPAAAAFFERHYDRGLVKVRRHFDAAAEGDALTKVWDEWLTERDGVAFEGDPDADAADHDGVENASLTAEDALRERLLAPRTPLTALLGTLQPEQYALVSADPAVSLVVQGHAGTGKTVVATHRAAWLTHAEREHRLGRVLLLGPTPTWAMHIAPVIAELGTPDTIVVRSLTQVLAELLGTDAQASRSTFDGADVVHATSEQLGRTLAVVVADQLRADPELTPARAYDAFLKTNRVAAPGGTRRDFAEWRETLPRTFDAAMNDMRLWPLLAYLVVLLSEPERHAHVIVDEAQDLRPLELLVLARLDAGTWTLIGDMRQRRTSYTPGTWKRVRKLLGIEEQPEKQLAGGYRSTQAIIDFAGSLLPRSDARRNPAVLGAGAPPRVVDASARGTDLPATVLDEALRLVDAHPDGVVAVITALVGDVAERASDQGWRTDASQVWRDESGRRFSLLTSEQARGLEFDALVVAEPAAFRERAGDLGPLYTALTRANLELTVVHRRSLPPALVRYIREHPDRF
ncbi:hypothetical protein GCM10009785_25800 [Brooklawnia cerclae]